MKTDDCVIYFAGSIRGGREDAAIYAQLIERLRKYGRVLTEHIGSPNLTDSGEEASPRAIHDRDLEWVRASTVVVAEVTTPSLGVGYEIGRATESGKPVLCLFRTGSQRSLSAMISGCPDATVREYARIDEVDRILEEFFAQPR